MVPWQAANLLSIKRFQEKGRKCPNEDKAFSFIYPRKSWSAFDNEYEIWTLQFATKTFARLFISLDCSEEKGRTNFPTAVTRMDTPKYGETLKFMYITYQPFLVALPKVYQV